ncbi:HET domain-containing protein [Microdochium nivale]|nr:HET domain-containing protein [Microdochium nivale]
MNTTHKYRPLAPSSIRLIRILEEPESNIQVGPIRCKMVHMPLSGVPRLPEYIAISHVWGSANTTEAGETTHNVKDNERGTRTIILDGQPFEIPTNLWHALHSCRRWESLDAARDRDPTRGFGPRQMAEVIFCVRRPWLFWADVICINQADAQEKAREIPRMLDIFGSAKEVLGWLSHRVPPGINSDSLGHTLDMARDLASSHKKDEQAKDDEQGSSYGKQLSTARDWHSMRNGSETHLRRSLGLNEAQMADVVDNVFAIASLPWFTRLWIIQEYVAAQNGVVLALGPHIFDEFAFHYLFSLITYRSTWFQRPTSLGCALAMSQIEDQFRDLGRKRSAKNGKVARVHRNGLKLEFRIAEITEHDRGNSPAAFARRLADVLHEAGAAPFRSTLEHDMIYGVFGIAGPLPDPVPPDLAIDYSVPWILVCQRYARFIAEQTGDISFLTRIRPVQNIHYHRAQLRDTRNHLLDDDGDDQGFGSKGVPSWVPDFASHSITFSTAPWRYNEPDRYRGHHIEFSETAQGLTMTLDAIILGKPATMTTKTNLVQVQNDHYNKNKGPTVFLRSEARDFIREVLQPATRLQKRPLAEVMASWISRWEDAVDQNIDDSEVSLIRKTFASWALSQDSFSQSRRLDHGLDVTRSKIAGRTFSRRGQVVWRRMRNKSVNKNWIVTGDGRGWMTLFLDDLCPERDVVAVLRGLEEYPAVLRQTSGGEGTFDGGTRYCLVGLLIERVPLAGVDWEDCWLKELGGPDPLDWSRVTII